MIILANLDHCCNPNRVTLCYELDYREHASSNIIPRSFGYQMMEHPKALQDSQFTLLVFNRFHHKSGEINGFENAENVTKHTEVWL